MFHAIFDPREAPGRRRYRLLPIFEVLSMAIRIKPGAVVFARDVQHLARFYAGLAGLMPVHADASHAVLASDDLELVLHALSGESLPDEPPVAREDTYVKLFFPVASLADAREDAARLGGRLLPAGREWTARGFRACDGVDPEGNVFQLRQAAPLA